ncbi:MAG: type II/IV secretion system protein [Planctomycetes bacterium]|nr:type II/IV secretion system protein [Planctomycetota bacterium]
MALTSEQLLSAAEDTGLVNREDTAKLRLDALRSRQDPLEVATSRLRLPREAFYRALAVQRGLPFAEAHELTPDPELVARVPLTFLVRRQVLPIASPEGAVRIATSEPDDTAALENLRRLLARPVTPVIADPAAVQAALRRLDGEADSASWDAVAFLHDLMRQAFLRRASDVHLDPRQDGLAVRVRIDGRLRDVGPRLRHDDALQLATRIKVLAGLDIAERREPQDGGFSYVLGGLSEAPSPSRQSRSGAPPTGRGRTPALPEDEQTLDVRVATIPSRYGERLTLRLLGLETRRLTLDSLGFEPPELARLQGVLERSDGMLLVAGPTGSGKTTTLYAALRSVTHPEVSVLTVEDPIEFEVEGATQIQVDRAGKVTFARALRSLLRHDPDVIMVGEIRDEETADIALKAAMTGHLVLSSIHTASAPGAVARLADLGCQPYLVASTLRGVVAQRLVRRLCPACRAPRPATAAELEALQAPEACTVYDPRGCPACVGTGYHGRLAVTETLWFDAALQSSVARGAPESALRGAVARTLLENGLAKVLAGETSVREVVTRC